MSPNLARNDVTIIQSADANVYNEMLRLGQSANRVYAEKHRLGYEAFLGIKRGYFPWHACFNRLFLINDFLHTSYKGWIFYLDADAYIYDMNFDVMGYLTAHGDRAMVAAAGGLTGERWDINDGVFFLNLRNGCGREIARLWYDDFMSTPEDALRKAREWEDVPSDQPRLHKILRDRPYLSDQIHIEDRMLLNHAKASFVRQAVRGAGFSIQQRMDAMRSGIQASMEIDNCPSAVADEKKEPVNDKKRVVNQPGVVFQQLYDGTKADWGNSSGPGSHAYYNLEYRMFLEKFIHMNSIKSIVDVGCGDWQFMRFVNLDGINYLGLDVVPQLIQQNKIHYTRPSISFDIMPNDIADVPSADLLLIKDVLQHLPNMLIREYMQTLIPKYKVCLITNSFDKHLTPRNIDIEMGKFRCLDLTAAPFNMRGWYVCEFWTRAWERIRTLICYLDSVGG